MAPIDRAVAADILRIAVLVLIIGVAGCGGSGGTDAAPTPPQSIPSGEPEEPPATPPPTEPDPIDPPPVDPPPVEPPPVEPPPTEPSPEEPPQVNLPDPPLARTIEPAQSQLLLGTGTTRSLNASALDAMGNGVDVPLAWRSEDPSIASVSANGEVLGVSVGSTHVIVSDATRNGTASSKVLVSVAGTAAGTTVIEAGWITGGPALVSSAAAGRLFGEEVELTLSREAPALSAGDQIVADDWSAFGRVLSVSQLAEDRLVRIETSRLDGFFEDLDFRSVASLDDMSSGEETALSALAAEGTGSPVSPGETSASAGSSSIKIGLDEKISCEANTSLGITGVASDIDPQVEVLLLDTEHRQTVTAGVFTYGHLLINADFRVHLNGRIDWNPEFSLKLTCTAPIQPTPFYQHGPLVVAVPLGLGFELDVTGNTTFAHFDSQGYIDVTSTLGIRYTLQDGLEAIAEADSNSENIEISVNFTELEDIESVTASPSIDIYSWVKPRMGLGITPQLALFLDVEEGRIGNRVGVVAGGTDAQLQQNFASHFDYDIYGKRIVEDPSFVLNSSLPLMFLSMSIQVLEALTPLDIGELLSWELAVDVDENPRPDMSGSPDSATEGELTTLRVAAINPEFLVNNTITRVEIYRVTGTGLTAQSSFINGVNAGPAQTEFEVDWTPSEEDANAGTVRLVPVMYSWLLPGIPIVGGTHSVDVEPQTPPANLVISNRVISWAYAGLAYQGVQLDDNLAVQTENIGEPAVDSTDWSVGRASTRAQSYPNSIRLNLFKEAAATIGVINFAVVRTDVDFENLRDDQAVAVTLTIGELMPELDSSFYSEQSEISLDFDFNVESGADRQDVIFNNSYEIKLSNSRPDGVWLRNSGNTSFNGENLSITLPPVAPGSDGKLEINLDIELRADFYGARAGSSASINWDVRFDYDIVEQ